MSLRVILGPELRRLVPVERAVEVLARAFAAERPPTVPPRARTAAGSGELLLMPAIGTDGVGVKVVTVNPENPAQGLPFVHAVYALFDGRSLAPRAVIDGEVLTALRTAAVSALATRHLALPNASHLVVFGAGTTAKAHLEAMRAVRPIRTVTVVSRTRSRAEALAETAREWGVDARVGEPDDVAEADVVCTCTTSPEPVFDGRLLSPGAHVNAIGAFTPETRELDDTAMARARVVVETREAALAEAGDILIPLRAGRIEESRIVADLQEVVRGRTVRTAPDDVTVFKSVGVALADLAVALAAVEARGEGPGTMPG
jgi:ornithine cyclodeaminase/alanine dehydrogenase-like protein (mu-crystallin family)